MKKAMLVVVSLVLMSIALVQPAFADALSFNVYRDVNKTYVVDHIYWETVYVGQWKQSVDPTLLYIFNEEDVTWKCGQIYTYYMCNFYPDVLKWYVDFRWTYGCHSYDGSWIAITQFTDRNINTEFKEYAVLTLWMYVDPEILHHIPEHTDFTFDMRIFSYLVADANRDGKVGILDAALVSAYYMGPTDPLYPETFGYYSTDLDRYLSDAEVYYQEFCKGDLNFDRIVNIIDSAMVSFWWGSHV